MRYEISINYSNSSCVIVTTDGKHAVAGFLLDALNNHEEEKFPIVDIRVNPISEDVTPVRLGIKEKENAVQ